MKKIILCVSLIITIILNVSCLNEQGDITTPSVSVIGYVSTLADNTTTDITGLLYGDGNNIIGVVKPNGTIVGDTDAQTITNKTITSPVINGTITTTTGCYFNTGNYLYTILTEHSAPQLWMTADNNPCGIMFERDDDTPNNGDTVGAIIARAYNDAGTPEPIDYSIIRMQIEDKTDGNEDGKMTFYNKLAGVETVGMTLSSDGSLWVLNNCSALSFTDRTKWYDGNALDALSTIKGDKGLIDHNSLPVFAKKTVPYLSSENITLYRDERDLGAMITLLTKSVQELNAKISLLENEISKLKGD